MKILIFTHIKKINGFDFKLKIAQISYIFLLKTGQFFGTRKIFLIVIAKS